MSISKTDKAICIIKNKYKNKWKYAAFNYLDWFKNVTIDLFELVKDEGMGCFNVPIESEHYDDLYKKYGISFDSVATDIIYETMIYHLRMSDGDYVEKILYGKNIYDEDYITDYFDNEKYDHITKICIQNKNAFMKLFKIFFFQLWD